MFLHQSIEDSSAEQLALTFRQIFFRSVLSKKAENYEVFETDLWGTSLPTASHNFLAVFF